MEYFLSSCVSVSGVSFLRLAKTDGRRDLYQADGLLDAALNLADVNVRDSIEKELR
jgi:hypothetical protein